MCLLMLSSLKIMFPHTSYIQVEDSLRYTLFICLQDGPNGLLLSACYHIDNIQPSFYIN